jgi:hypothetical protein
VVPKTTRPEHRTSSTTEAIENTFSSNPAAGGTDRRSKTDPELSHPQKTTEVVLVRRNHPGKTELCGRPAVSQIEVQPGNTEVLQGRFRFNPQRKTAQYNQIFTPTQAVTYCYDTTQGGNKSETIKVLQIDRY